MTTAPFDPRPVEDPSELGVDPDALAGLIERAQRDVDAGLVPGCQFTLARHGRVAATVALGDADPTSRFVMYSATKAVVASAVWILIGEGALDVSRRVVDYIPEFAPNGKDGITVEQVLLHTSGFPHAPFNALEWDDRDARLARFASWRCNWEPGTRYEYHPTSAHWILAELIERVGSDVRGFVRTRVIEPLGLTRLALGVAPADQSPEDQDDVRAVVHTGELATEDELMAAIGVRSLPMTEVTPAALRSFNRPEMRAVGVPGAGGISTSTDLALFYQALLSDPVGIWKPELLADVTANVRNRFPDYMGTPANRTLGLIVAGDDGRSNLRGMGRTVSPRAFGHNGAGGQIAWADPATGVSFAYLTNGLDQHVLREWRRTSALASRAGLCVPFNR